MISHSDLVAEHARKLAAFEAKQASDLERAAEITRKATEEHLKATAAAEAAHTAAIEQRWRTLRKESIAALMAPVRAYMSEDSRSNAGVLADAYRALDARWRNELGISIDPKILPIVFITIALESCPEGRAAAYGEHTLTYNPTGVMNAFVAFQKAVLEPNVQPIELLTPLRQAEERTFHVVRKGGRHAAPLGQKRWELHCTGGAPETIKNELKELALAHDRGLAADAVRRHSEWRESKRQRGTRGESQ
jgi:hypothetical protein